MRNVVIINVKTGIEGYIMHFYDNDVIKSKTYYARFKGNGGGYFGRFYKGSELTLIRTNL